MIRHLSIHRVGLVLTLILATTLAVAPSTLARNANPGILPPNTRAHGGYGELSARWWQWAYSIPADQNPLFDETGARCGAGDVGDVFFLVGVINVSGIAERQCTVPPGTRLFFPLLNVECSTIEGNGATEAELQACTDFYIGTMTDLFAEIDGVPVENIESYQANSPPFTIGPLPENNLLQGFGYDAPAGSTSLAVADGFYLLLTPLPAGDHTIVFGGTFGDPINFTLEITYHLTVAS